MTHEIQKTVLPYFEPYVDSETAARYLAMDVKHLQELTRRGIVPGYPVVQGGRRKTWKYKISELDAYMKKNRSLPGEKDADAKRKNGDKDRKKDSRKDDKKEGK